MWAPHVVLLLPLLLLDPPCVSADYILALLYRDPACAGSASSAVVASIGCHPVSPNATSPPGGDGNETWARLRCTNSTSAVLDLFPSHDCASGEASGNVTYTPSTDVPNATWGCARRTGTSNGTSSTTSVSCVRGEVPPLPSSFVWWEGGPAGLPPPPVGVVRQSPHGCGEGGRNATRLELYALDTCEVYHDEEEEGGGDLVWRHTYVKCAEGVLKRTTAVGRTCDPHGPHQIETLGVACNATAPASGGGVSTHAVCPVYNNASSGREGWPWPDRPSPSTSPPPSPSRAPRVVGGGNRESLVLVALAVVGVVGGGGAAFVCHKRLLLARRGALFKKKALPAGAVMEY